MLFVDILINEAWMHREPGCARSVRKDDWKPFKDKIEAARQYLLDYDHFKNVDPYWYESMLIIAKAQSWNMDQFYLLLDEALSAHSHFYDIYFSAIDYLQPRCHGSAEEIEKFATYAAKKYRSHEGNGMYARVYWYASQLEYGFSLFSKSIVRWEQMKLGIDDVIKKYPDQWNINNFFDFFFNPV